MACSDLPTAPPTPALEANLAARVSFRPPPWSGCRSGTQPGGALYEMCFPDAWNGDVVVWARGYVAPQQPLAIPATEIDGRPISRVVADLGYGYATTSYRRNGLVADLAAQDLGELAGLVGETVLPRFRFLIGASEGGLATVLALERAGTKFDGALAACGPVGSFRAQINHFGDFRTIFDYFFPGVLPGDATTVPQVVRDGWETTYVPLIVQQLNAHPAKTAQLLSVTRASHDPADPSTVVQTVVGNLWYNVFGADDVVARLGGNPYDNRWRWYFGSHNDFLLNLRVKRYRASPMALAALSAFETSGALQRPVLTLHTTGDPIVPYWHQPFYHFKALRAGSSLRLLSFPVVRYGHCTFRLTEAVASFAALVLRVTGEDLIASAAAFPSPAARREFLALARAQGVAPLLVEDRVWQAEARRQLTLPATQSIGR